MTVPSETTPQLQLKPNLVEAVAGWLTRKKVIMTLPLKTITKS